MLQLPGERSLVASTSSELREALERARNAVESLGLAPLLEGVEKIYVAYSGRYFAPASAWLLYWPVVQLTQLNMVLHSVEDIAYHLLAYREENAAIFLFAEPGAENNIVRIMDSAYHTGARLLAVVPPLPPVIESRLRGGEVMEVENPPLATMYILLSATLAARIVTEHRGVELRRKRFVEELASLHTVYDELLQSYREHIETMTSKTYDLIASSPTMRPAAYMARLYYELARRIYVSIASVSEIVSMYSLGAAPRRILAFTTTVEQDMLREITYRTNLLGDTVLDAVTIGTDPLTAPLYGALLASAPLTNTKK